MNSILLTFHKDVKDIIISVYDCTNKKIFEEIKNYWYEEINKKNHKDKILVLILNKNGLYQEAQVGNEEGESFDKEINVNFVSISAKSNNDIQNLLKKIMVIFKIKLMRKLI